MLVAFFPFPITFSKDFPHGMFQLGLVWLRVKQMVKSVKMWIKTENGRLPVFCSFLLMFLKAVFYRVIKANDYFVK